MTHMITFRLYLFQKQITSSIALFMACKARVAINYSFVFKIVVLATPVCATDGIIFTADVDMLAHYV